MRTLPSVLVSTASGLAKKCPTCKAKPNFLCRDHNGDLLAGIIIHPKRRALVRITEPGVYTQVVVLDESESDMHRRIMTQAREERARLRQTG